MSNYERVIPRDLFNEADLLKSLGKLVLLLGDTRDHNAQFDIESVDFFDIVQDPGSGAISVANLPFSVGGIPHQLKRSLNARTKWPLWMTSEVDPDFEVRVFDEDGTLSAEMAEAIIVATT